MINGNQTTSPIIEENGEQGIRHGRQECGAQEKPQDEVTREQEVPESGDNSDEDWLDRLEMTLDHLRYDDMGEDQAPPGVPEGGGQRRRRQPARRQGRSRQITRPEAMTKTQLAEHRIQGHAVYHPGCRHCVMAKAVADRHRRRPSPRDEEEQNGPPVIGADFCFPDDEDSAKPLTVLVIKDSHSKSIFAHSCPGKTVTEGEGAEYIITKVVDNIDSLGHEQVVFQTDGESAMKALQAKVQWKRHKPVILMNPPRGESQSNGATEKAVQDFEGTFRAMRLDLEASLGAKTPLQHPLVHWMVEAAAERINRFREVKDGKTPLELIRGVHETRPMAEFGECIYFIPAKGNRPQHKADAKFKEGIWLGMNARTDEVIVFGYQGIEFVRTVRRAREEGAFDKDKALAVNVRPWDRSTLQYTNPQGTADEPVAKEYQEDAPGTTAKRTNLRTADVEAAGYTADCPGCRSILLGLRQQAHSEECRECGKASIRVGTRQSQT